MISDKAISDNHTPGRATDYGTNLILQLVPINAHARDIVYCLITWASCNGGSPGKNYNAEI